MPHDERNFSPSLISDGTDSERECPSAPVPVFDFFSASKQPQSMPATTTDAAKVPPSLCLTLTPSLDIDSPSPTKYSPNLAPSTRPAGDDTHLRHHSPSQAGSTAMKVLLAPTPSFLERFAASSSSDNDGDDPHIDGHPSVGMNDCQDYEQSQEDSPCQARTGGVKSENHYPGPVPRKQEKEHSSLHDTSLSTSKPVKPKASHGRTGDRDDQTQWQAEASQHQQQQQKRAPPLPYHWPLMGLFSPPAMPPCMPLPFATPWLYGCSPQYPMQEAISLAAAMNVNPAMAAAAVAALGAQGAPHPLGAPALIRPHPSAAPAPARTPTPARPNSFSSILPGGVSGARLSGQGCVPCLLPCNTSHDSSYSVTTASHRVGEPGNLIEQEPGTLKKERNESVQLQKSASAGFRPWKPAVTRGKMPWSQLVQPLAAKPTPPLTPTRSATAPCVSFSACPLAWPPTAAAAATGTLAPMPLPLSSGSGAGMEACGAGDFSALYGMRHSLWGCGMPPGYLAAVPASTATAAADEMKRRLGKIRLPARGSKRQRVDNDGAVWTADTNDRPDINNPADSCRVNTCGPAGELVAHDPQQQAKASVCIEGEERTARVCNNCGTVSTPFWRKDPVDSGMHLCNACGLYMAKNDAPRPSSLWKKAG